MDFGLDRSAVLDLEELVADRRLGAGAAMRLFRAMTGDLPGNRDRPLWEAAHVLAGCLVVAQAQKPRDRILEFVLDRDRGRAGYFAERLGGSGVRAPLSARGDADGLALDGPELAWQSSWQRVAEAFAVLDALATADDLERCGSVMAAVEALHRDLAAGATAIRDCARALGRVAHDWRQRHMADLEFERRSVALLRHLAATGRDAASGRIADDDLLAFWSARVEQGDRLTFRTALDMGCAVERVAADRRSLVAFAAAVDVDTHPEAGGDTAALGAPEALLEALERLPTRPKVLTGPERDALARAFATAPWHVSHPASLLRAAVFGDAQALLVEAERRKTSLAPDRAIAQSGSYAAHAEAWQTLGRHLAQLLQIAVTLDPSAELAPEVAERGRKTLKSMRRAGFDAELDALRATFREIESDLFMVEAGAAKHLAALDGLDRRRSLVERQEADRTVFLEGFVRLYGGQEGTG
jgi:hypothetical protein